MTDVAPSPPVSLAEEYRRHADAREARIAAVLAEHGLGGLFRGMRRCPVEQGYRMRASFYVGRDDGDAARIVGVDPRRGRVAMEEARWVLPEHARPLVRDVAARVAATPRQGGITGFEVRLEFGGGRAHLTLAAERGSASHVELCRALLDQSPGLLGIALPSQAIELGETHLRHELLDSTILAHHLAFFQTNRWLTADLAAGARGGGKDTARTIER